MGLFDLVVDALSSVFGEIDGLDTLLLLIATWIHVRLRAVEENAKDQARTLYGSEKDAMSDGLTKNVRDTKERVEQINDRLGRHERLLNRIDSSLNEQITDDNDD